MNKLIHELHRLYLFNEQHGPVLELAEPDGAARAMVLGFAKPSAWDMVARIYEGLQADLALPAPALAVSGNGGYQIWLSLAESVPSAEVARFLAKLRMRYAADLPEADLYWRPDSLAGSQSVQLVPAQDDATGKWSAYIDPTMGAMFVDEPGLEMAPGMERQAEMLGRLKSISAAEFQAASELLGRENKAEELALSSDAGLPRSTGNIGQNFKDPKSFLLAVMNAESASLAQRIEAAKALLPYFDTKGEVSDER